MFAANRHAGPEEWLSTGAWSGGGELQLLGVATVLGQWEAKARVFLPLLDLAHMEQ